MGNIIYRQNMLILLDFHMLSQHLISIKRTMDNFLHLSRFLKQISDFMANLAKPNSDRLSILDPGCGTAILSCSLIEKLVLNSGIKEINLTLYETDESVITQTKLVADYLAK